MTESALVDTRVRAFANHIQCDPELAQEMYFKHKVSSMLDNEQKASSVRELDVLQIVRSKTDLIRGYCAQSLRLSRRMEAWPPQFQGPASRTTGL